MAWLMTQCIALAVTLPILHVRASDGAGEQKIRPAAVAGAFYPAESHVSGLHCAVHALRRIRTTKLSLCAISSFIPVKGW